jgi:hypothetical protein
VRAKKGTVEKVESVFISPSQTILSGPCPPAIVRNRRRRQCRGQFDVAQRGRLEFTIIGRLAGDAAHAGFFKITRFPGNFLLTRLLKWIL